MSDFFEPPPESIVPQPQRYRQPPWIGAPQGTLPGVVAMELVMAQTEKVAVCVSRLAAYPVGFEFDVVTMMAADQPELDPMLFQGWRGCPLLRSSAYDSDESTKGGQ